MIHPLAGLFLFCHTVIVPIILREFDKQYGEKIEEERKNRKIFLYKYTIYGKDDVVFIEISAKNKEEADSVADQLFWKLTEEKVLLTSPIDFDREIIENKSGQ